MERQLASLHERVEFELAADFVSGQYVTFGRQSDGTTGSNHPLSAGESSVFGILFFSMWKNAHSVGIREEKPASSPCARRNPLYTGDTIQRHGLQGKPWDISPGS